MAKECIFRASRGTILKIFQCYDNHGDAFVGQMYVPFTCMYVFEYIIRCFYHKANAYFTWKENILHKVPSTGMVKDCHDV